MAHQELPKKYRAAVYDKPGSISIKIEEKDMPVPGQGEVLLKLTHSGVCHSDLGIMTNGWASSQDPTPAGQIGGHEGVGVVVQLGAGAEDHVKLGDRVGVKWIFSACLSCPPCLRGYEGICANQKVSGYFTPGTFQQYILAPANYVTPIPDGLDGALAAPMLCAGLTTYAALKRSEAKGGDWVVLLGAGGGLGNLAIQLANKAFAHRVIGVDAESKRDLVLSSGAEHFIPLEGTKSIIEAVKGLTGGEGAQAVLVLTAANAAYADAVDMLRFAGTLVCVGLPEGKQIPIASAVPMKLIDKAAKIVGVSVGNRQETIECLDFAARGLVKPHVRVEKLDKLADTFHDMHDRKVQGRVVLDLQS
ncbi:alcohol dehydrogenase-like protein [Aaosphaeria arxii CBS 175.79]|uniref:Alcohol dehydrogenase-like protein n=1 Tax=Aaosphaeria arxii CBS 175.79 TaxID=1450172 RepID=A0A6A5Y323_9PLEO|nr:alcohol dehydrogenase-like protein [Aaosphaeria arxii CBS 175.79]KAF2019828.1 alcohol dehydrogenase-like protein [Aaosphaeria arxii CBS 175.79]